MHYAAEALKADGVAPQGARLTALAVHALSPADRLWVLAQLAPRQRHALEPLLNELNELGMPTDASSALNGVVAQRDAAPGDTLAPRARAGDLPPDLSAWLAVSDAEPVGLVALALQPLDKAVQHSALGLLPVLRRKLVQAELDTLVDDNHAQRKLTQCLASELALLASLPLPADAPLSAPLLPPAQESLSCRLRAGIERGVAIALRRVGTAKARS